jgi:hypothetical protein
MAESLLRDTWVNLDRADLRLTIEKRTGDPGQCDGGPLSVPTENRLRQRRRDDVVAVNDEDATELAKKLQNQILLDREKIKRLTMEHRRLQAGKALHSMIDV